MDWLSLIFPKKCVACNELGSYICPDCLNLLRPIRELYCPVCRKKSYGGHTHPRCRNLHEIDGLLSGYVYQGVIKQIIAKYKYKFISDLNHTVVELFISEIKSPQLFKSSWTLIPIPLHPKRYRWRGFNQAELLAKGLGEAWGFPVLSQLLIRQRQTSSQMELSATERQHNLIDAFTLSSHAPIPKSILLVDDVATSCTTLREATRVLKQAGAQEVWGLTLAQALPA